MNRYIRNLALFCLLIGIGFPAVQAEETDSYLFSVTGKITFQDLEGGFYGIITEDGRSLLPLDLPEEFQIDGLVVNVSVVPEPDIMTIQMWGTPVSVKSIKPADNPGVFAISRYAVQPISVLATDTSYLQMSEILFNATSAIQIGLNRIDSSGQAAAYEMKGKNTDDPEITSIMESCLAVPGVYEVALMDTSGILTHVVPDMYNASLGVNVSFQPLNARLIKNPVSGMSEYFLTIEEKDGIILSYPVFSNNNTATSYLSLLFDPFVLVREYAGSFTNDTPYSLMVIQPDGILLYSENTAEIGSSVWDNSELSVNDPAKIFSVHYQTALSGFDRYSSKADSSELAGKKEALWASVSLYQTSWRVMITRER